MATIEFPPKLKELLNGSKLEAPVRALADRAGDILADNQMPFFPDYTDHGIEHVQRVLETEVELVPTEVWERQQPGTQKRLLDAEDAAVIIGATLLHDFAMHLRPKGFLELVGKESRFKPLRWFDKVQTDQSADRPWDELWADYEREVRRFSDRDLAVIIGEESARVWKYGGLPQDTGRWDRNLHLIIGEFIRRHHARLAHEIAMYGMPGLKAGTADGEFPAIGCAQADAELRKLADLTGLTARSHGMSLRVCQAYLAAWHQNMPRPMGVAVLYPMALLRVADYLQIEGKRAPAVLLNLREPPSPVSVMEWHKHQAVMHVGPGNDPRCKMVNVSQETSLPVYLQLRELLRGIQKELDHSSAVLDEAYGNLKNLGLHELGLSIRRVDSNLHTPAFREALPYVPERTGFSADPNLLSLLVEPLYGAHPGVGIRELMQNALDAVRELDAWCKKHSRTVAEKDLPAQEADVLIEYIEQDDSTWCVRVTDKGIGMTGDTLQNYFLRAGASFRNSSAWRREFVDEDTGRPRVVRTGRFGIGAFAVFLLGPKFKLSTRHVSAGETEGWTLEAAEDSHLIEIRRSKDRLPVGTMIEVVLSDKAESGLRLDFHPAYPMGLSHVVNWHTLTKPLVQQKLKNGDKTNIIPCELPGCSDGECIDPEWNMIQPEGFDSVLWTWDRNAPALACNGIKIMNPSSVSTEDAFDWDRGATGLMIPKISVTDRNASLALDMRRYRLSDPALPFCQELVRDIYFSLIAHALICGPQNYTEAVFSLSGHPLRVGQTAEFASFNGDFRDDHRQPFQHGRLRWCATNCSFVPTDTWLWTLLKKSHCIAFGPLFQGDLTYQSSIYIHSDVSHLKSIGDSLAEHDFAFLYWPCRMIKDEYNCRGFFIQMLHRLVQEGMAALPSQPRASKIVACTKDELTLIEMTEGQTGFASKFMEPHLKDYLVSPKSCADEAADCAPLLQAIDLLKEAFKNRFPPAVIYNLLFAAELQPQAGETRPDSMLANIWNECLGPRAIPFDPAERKELIEHGMKHPELKRHLEKWRTLKNQGWPCATKDARAC